jgi:hypothetical protein
MKSKSAWPMILIASVALVGAVAAVASPTPTVAGEDAARACCVANPRFSGICKVELGPDETCRDVLAYLNNAASAGKSYCGNTDVRGGWKEVACQEEQATGARTDSCR